LATSRHAASGCRKNGTLPQFLNIIEARLEPGRGISMFLPYFRDNNASERTYQTAVAIFMNSVWRERSRWSILIFRIQTAISWKRRDCHKLPVGGLTGSSRRVTQYRYFCCLSNSTVAASFNVATQTCSLLCASHRPFALACFRAEEVEWLRNLGRLLTAFDRVCIAE
jgi:hypothetical protein